MAIERIGWYLIDGTVFSPDGKLEILYTSPKIQNIPDLIINEPKLLQLIETASELSFENGSLYIHKNKKQIKIISNIAVNNRIPKDIRSMFESSKIIANNKQGTNVSELYKLALTSSIPSLAMLGMYGRKLSCLVKEYIIVGTEAHIDFIKLDENNNRPMFMWLMLEEIVNYVDTKLFKDIEVYQINQDNDIEVIIKTNNITFRGSASYRQRSSTDNAYNLIQINHNEHIATFNKEVYAELSSEIKSQDVRAIDIMDNNIISISGGIFKNAMRINVPDGTIHKDNIRIPADIFGYKLSKDQTLDVYFTDSSAAPLFVSELKDKNGEVVIKSIIAGWK